MIPNHRALSAALLVAFSPLASAELSVSQSGRGDALYMPLYDVAEGRDSLLTVRNTGDRPSAIRVVLSEAANGQTVLDFNLFLPAQATWTAALVEDGEGATLVSASSLCTVPRIPPDGVELRPFNYASNFPDGGETSRTRTRRGSVEVFELGSLDSALAAATNSGACNSLLGAYQPGASRNGLATPSAALSGNVQVVEVAEGTVYAIPAIAIRGFHTSPVDALPGAALPRLTTPQLAAGASHHVVDTPAGRFRFAGNRGADAVSSLFMASAISGEVVGDPDLDGRTEWLVAFPTKNVYVANLPGTVAGPGGLQPPFRERFDASGSCEPVAADERNLRGGERTTDQPGQQFDYQLCSQVNLKGFDPAEGSGSDLVRFDDTAQRYIEAEREDGTPVRLKGLPVVGWRLSSFSNAAAQPGVLASYTVALPLQSEPAVVEAR